MNNDWTSELARMKTENEKYRTMLERIARWGSPIYGPRDYTSQDAQDMRRWAIKAMEVKP